MLKFTPSIEEIKSGIQGIDKKVFISIWTEIIADLETPVSAYNKVSKGEKYSFLLESVEGGESVGRYSFIGCDPLFIIKSESEKSFLTEISKNKKILEADSPYDLLKKFFFEFAAIDFKAPLPPGFVGYLGYDTIRFIEPRLKEHYEKIEKCESFPDSYFMLGGIILAFDHVKHKIYVINNIVVDDQNNLENLYKAATLKIEAVLEKLSAAHDLKQLYLKAQDSKIEVESNITKLEWTEATLKAKEYIKAGDIFQVVLSQRFCVDRKGIDEFTIYRALRSINPSPYLYYLDFNEFSIIGSSPEALVKCNKEGLISTRPIAGTRKRGITPEKDTELAIELINDEKERAEHIMLVDLARNDIGRVSQYGTVNVERLMDIERFSHVMHIVSDVSGKLREEFDSIDLIKACFPAGTVSGAPKVRAMEIIYELEKSARGPYAGCIGYLGFDNEINVAITLRTMLVRGDKVFIQAGGGIVADSEPEFEYQESKNKAAALIQAVLRLKNR
ncbi:MAG TPA: anthranilate synthase component I [Candidatus Gastranaerophilales bacterium]|nr:anthranilate synthase component I [Candidatus Gastranaerophilales bacterium]